MAMLSRRGLLKTGAAGALLLGAAWWLRQPIDRLGKQALVAQAPLAPSMALVLPALLPVVLAGALPQEPQARAAALQRAAQSVGVAVSQLSAATQREVAELFALLALAPTRIAVARVTSAWPQASEAEVQRFLDAWRHSPLDLLRSGYQALHDLILGAWYADPSTWPDLGYPGPPKLSLT